MLFDEEAVSSRHNEGAFFCNFCLNKENIRNISITRKGINLLTTAGQKIIT